MPGMGNGGAPGNPGIGMPMGIGGMPLPPGGGIMPPGGGIGMGGKPGGGMPPGKAKGGGGATPGFWPSIGFEEDWPSAA